MRTLISILLCYIILTECKAQRSDYLTYLNNFGQKELPLIINDKTSSSEVFCQTYDTLFQIKVPKNIPENLIAKYICADGFCNADGGYFRYDYGVRINLSESFTSLLVSKLQYEGDCDLNFDLREVLLITYNNNGEILFRQYLTKDNDMWKSSLKISKDSITVKQAKIIDQKIGQNNSELQCEYWTTTYKALSDGIVKKINTSSASFGKLVWNENEQDYILKE